MRGSSPGRVNEIVDYLLDRHYDDGGWNCRWDRGDPHSSLHTTLSVLEAIRDHLEVPDAYRARELAEAASAGREFILRKQLFRSERTGEVIDPRMLMLSFPPRWKYDVLRALDYFASVGAPTDPRMADALDVLGRKRRADGRWPVQHKHSGRVHFDMETTGAASRWNTLRAVRVRRHLGVGAVDRSNAT